MYYRYSKRYHSPNALFMTLHRQRELQLWLIAALQDARAYDHPADDMELIETHISYVLLSGQFAYKIKKALDLGFLDFSTLEKRRHCCEEELRLNRRTAPRLYLEVLPVTGSPHRPHMGGTGTAIEYAVRMQRFSQRAVAAYLMKDGKLTMDHMDQIAATLAAFHGTVDVAGAESPWGTPQLIRQSVMDNFDAIAPGSGTGDDWERLAALRNWSEHTFITLEPVLAARRGYGFIRECHGDMHLGNLVMLDGHITAFDCIDFNPALRWIDVISEAAFLVMDLEDHGRGDFAWRFTNAYLEHTGDYRGMAVMAFYKTYRAVVRAKVNRIRRDQTGINAAERDALDQEYQGYISLAERSAGPAPTQLIITHGLSGSGKTTVARALAAQLGAVHIRSDIERKRLYGMVSVQHSASGLDQGLYSREASEHTYARLTALAADLLVSGYSVVVDAAFLNRAQRSRLRALALERGIPWAILDVHAPERELRTRITRRLALERDASEADLAVLDSQIRHRQPLTGAEQACSISVDTSLTLDLAGLLRRISTLSGGQN